MVVTGPVGPYLWAMPKPLGLQEKGEKEDSDADDAGWARRWPLHAAAQDGHVDRVRHMLKADWCPWAWDERGDAPLHCAARAGRTAATALLVAEGASPSQANGANLSPLEVAAKEGHYDATQAMLDRGASANYRLVEAALLVASTGPVVRALWRTLPFGASRVTSTEALRRMARDGHEDALRTIIAMGAPSSAHEGGLFPTLLALQDDLRQRAEMGRDMATLKAVGLTALHIAAIHNQAQCVQALLECRASANARDGDGQTALHKAVGLSHTDCVSVLIKHGVRLNVRDANGRTPLHIAASQVGSSETGPAAGGGGRQCERARPPGTHAAGARRQQRARGAGAAAAGAWGRRQQARQRQGHGAAPGGAVRAYALRPAAARPRRRAQHRRSLRRDGAPQGGAAGQRRDGASAGGRRGQRVGAGRRGADAAARRGHQGHRGVWAAARSCRRLALRRRHGRPHAPPQGGAVLQPGGDGVADRGAARAGGHPRHDGAHAAALRGGAGPDGGHDAPHRSRRRHRRRWPQWVVPHPLRRRAGLRRLRLHAHPARQRHRVVGRHWAHAAALRRALRSRGGGARAAGQRRGPRGARQLGGDAHGGDRVGAGLLPAALAAVAGAQGRPRRRRRRHAGVARAALGPHQQFRLWAARQRRAGAGGGRRRRGQRRRRRQRRQPLPAALRHRRQRRLSPRPAMAAHSFTKVTACQYCNPNLQEGILMILLRPFLNVTQSFEIICFLIRSCLDGKQSFI